MFLTSTDRASTIYPVTYAVANSVRGLLDRKMSEELKYHKEVLYLQPMIPPKRFDIFPPDQRDAQKV